MHYLIEFRKTLHGQVHGDASCEGCDWCAHMIGDSQDEVDLFLSALVVEHALDIHHETFMDNVKEAHDAGL
jgi:hypothetical protein